MNEIGWQSIEFRPASPGWRAVYLDERERPAVEQIAGWLVQERPAGDRGARRVVPAFHNVARWGVEPVAVDQAPRLYRILAPGEVVPTAEEISDERAAREESSNPDSPRVTRG
jgi:hypothetical protein